MSVPTTVTVELKHNEGRQGADTRRVHFCSCATTLENHTDDIEGTDSKENCMKSTPRVFGLDFLL